MGRARTRNPRRATRAVRASHFLDIELAIYRLCVVVTWETTASEVVAWGRRHGVSVTADWAKGFSKDVDDLTCNGVCLAYGDHNVDMLVWLRRRPRKASEYGTLYHELFHAVQAIIRSRSLGREIESPAFLYEYLATKCNRVLWNLPRGRGTPA